MSLKAGSTVGSFEILAPLGAGGMGEVWQARDLKLGREVAIKVLPDTFTRDPDRLLRFEREARILASLNHSRIAGLYGLEELDGQKLLIMELARGETLAQRLGRGPIPLDEAIDIAMQVAEALEAAHEAGIVHRDLKPANVKLSEDGAVKVLDFGIAKVFESDEAPSMDDTSSPTMVKTAVFSRFSATDDGLTTWALPFDAKQKQATGEAVLVFENGAHPSVSRDGGIVYVSNVQARLSQLMWIDQEGRAGEPIGDARRNIVDPALSPDGSAVAVSILEGENQDVWIVDAGSGLRQRATFSGAEDRHPAWSPEGTAIAFSRRQRYDWTSPDNGVWLRSADGSSAETRLSSGTQPAFTTDGQKIVMNSISVRAENDLLMVAADGGSEPEPLLESKARTRGAVPSPDGRFVAFESAESGNVDVYVVSFPAAGGKWQISTGGGTRPRWSRSGDSIYFVRDNELWRVPVVSGRALSVGSPRRAASGSDAGVQFERGYDVARDGRIVAVRELDRERPTLTLVEN